MAKKPCIVVVDDEEETCCLLKDLLSADGYTVVTASDPEEGLQIVTKVKPGLVLLDLKMPKMDGIEVLRRIKRTDETIPVIIMTGFATIGSARDAIRLGALDYITKPFDFEYIKALVETASGEM